MSAILSKLDIFGQMVNSFLSNFIKGFIDNVTNASFFVPDNIFSMNGVSNKYEIMQKASKTFIIISLLVCIISLLFSLDIFSTAKFRRIINEFIFSLFIIYTGSYFINSFNALSNLFVKVFLPSNNQSYSSAIFAAIGVGSATGILETLGSFLLILVAIVAILLLLMMLTHSILLGLLQVLIIVFPVVMAVFPLNFGKNLTKGLVSLYGGLLALGPIQALVLNLLMSSLGQASNPTFANIMNALGMLILTVLVIPGVIIYVVSRASSPKLG